MRGGVKGRLEFFQKFIRFGSATLPLGMSLFTNLAVVFLILFKTSLIPPVKSTE